MLGVKTSYDTWAVVAQGESITGSFMGSGTFNWGGVSRSEGKCAGSAQSAVLMACLYVLGVWGVFIVSPGV